MEKKIATDTPLSSLSMKRRMLLNAEIIKLSVLVSPSCLQIGAIR